MKIGDLVLVTMRWSTEPVTYLVRVSTFNKKGIKGSYITKYSDDGTWGDYWIAGGSFPTDGIQLAQVL